MQTRIHAYVCGQVQGVGYRAATQLEARKLSLTGFVRNLPDGRVEFEAQGPRAKVDQLLDWAYVGPPDAEVTRIDSQLIAELPFDAVFEIRRTG